MLPFTWATLKWKTGGRREGVRVDFQVVALHPRKDFSLDRRIESGFFAERERGTHLGALRPEQSADAAVTAGPTRMAGRFWRTSRDRGGRARRRLARPRGLWPPAIEASTTNPSTRPEDLRRRFSASPGEETIARKIGRASCGTGPNSAGSMWMSTGSFAPVTSSRISVGFPAARSSRVFGI